MSRFIVCSNYRKERQYLFQKPRQKKENKEKRKREKKEEYSPRGYGG